MRYDTVIYDLDGTLLNTLDDLAAAVNHAMGELGFPGHSVEAVRAMVGNGMRLLIQRALPEDAFAYEEEALRLFKAYYARHAVDQTRAYPGVERLLAQLNAAGVRQAIVSNKGDAFVRELNQRFFGQWIALAIGDRDDLRRKPFPDSVLRVMAEYGASPSRTLYVGDSEVDVETARNAGVACASVTWGFRTGEQLLAAGGDYLVDEPAVLARHVLGAADAE